MKKLWAWIKKVLGIGPAPEPEPVMPTNPVCPADLPGTISESFSWKKKQYDGTYRITWPTTLAVMGVGEGSYTFVNGFRAEFRGFDTDGSAIEPDVPKVKRPKFSLPLAAGVTGPVLCVLHSRAGGKVAWFKLESTADRVGRLP